MEYHKPVLLKEILDYLNVSKGKKYIDCTLGDGGHAVEILKLGGEVLGLDYSQQALDRATHRIKELGLLASFKPVLGNFNNLIQIAQKHNFSSVDGILYDFGYSSYQLEEKAFGMSFMQDSPLDMRLDKTLGVSAADLLNVLSEKHLADMFFKYGDERLAKRYAKAIVEARSLKKLKTTKDLVDVIMSCTSLGYEHGRIHPATRVFQALRIVVNGELENLQTSLPQAARLLKLPGGRMLTISFHSLEDKLVKDFGRDVRPEYKLLVLTKKPITPSIDEIKENKKARSAKLRVFERI